jgi:integral membrane protein (TIGR01906 family)
MSPFTRRFLQLSVISLVPVLLIFGAARLLTTDEFLTFEYGKPSFPADVYGFTPEQRFILASTNIHYVRAHLPDDELVKQYLNGAKVFNEREVAHMADVRNVFQIILRIWQGSFILLVLLGVVFVKSGERTAFASAIKQGGFASAGIILAVGLLAIFARDTWFELFHRFLFVPGTWLFSYTDALIRLFPVQFWFDATATLAIIGFVGGLALALGGWQIQLQSSRIPEQVLAPR